MISTLELQQFRGLEQVKFGDLGRANLIVGGNNAGKTSVLEALMLLYGNHSQLKALPTTFREMPQNGQDSGRSFWRMLVHGENITGFKILADGEAVEGVIDHGQWQFRQMDDGMKNGSPVITFDVNWQTRVRRTQSSLKLSILSTKQADPAAISDLYNQIAPLNQENEAKLEDLLRKSIEPRLRILRYAKPQGTKTHLVYVGLGEGPMLPFIQLGQAFSRTLQVYCEIFASRPKILLVDEIENGLYYEGLEDYWKGLLAVLEDQLVMATLAKHAGIEGKLVFEDYGGETNLRRNLATLKVSPEFTRGEYTRVLVTRDADTNFSAAWTSVIGSIKTVFSCEPGSPGEWVDSAGGVPITAWVVPGPGKTGMIETLCLDAARSKNPGMFDCLDPFVACLAGLYDGAPHEKVRFALRTIMAQGKGAQDRLSLERALARLDLAWDDEAFAALKDVFVRLAG